MKNKLVFFFAFISLTLSYKTYCAEHNSELIFLRSLRDILQAAAKSGLEQQARNNRSFFAAGMCVTLLGGAFVLNCVKDFYSVTTTDVDETKKRIEDHRKEEMEKLNDYVQEQLADTNKKMSSLFIRRSYLSKNTHIVNNKINDLFQRNNLFIPERYRFERVNPEDELDNHIEVEIQYNDDNDNNYDDDYYLGESVSAQTQDDI